MYSPFFCGLEMILMIEQTLDIIPQPLQKYLIRQHGNLIPVNRWRYSKGKGGKYDRIMHPNIRLANLLPSYYTLDFHLLDMRLQQP